MLINQCLPTTPLPSSAFLARRAITLPVTQRRHAQSRGKPCRVETTTASMVSQLHGVWLFLLLPLPLPSPIHPSSRRRKRPLLSRPMLHKSCRKQSAGPGHSYCCRAARITGREDHFRHKRHQRVGSQSTNGCRDGFICRRGCTRAVCFRSVSGAVQLKPV